MRTLTKAGLFGALVLAVAYGALSVLGGPDPMPRPRRTAVHEDGRVMVTLQLCWWPDSVGGVISTQIAQLQKTDVQFNVECHRPWTTTGLVGRGDRIMLKWIMNPSASPASRTVDFRVTINNREVKRAQRKVANGSFECMVGVPPCTP